MQETPCDRLLCHPAIPLEVKDRLKAQRRLLDPVALLHRIREQQEALASLASQERHPNVLGEENLEQFMKRLGELWRRGEARPTHRNPPAKAHWWRTRPDPFEQVWPKILAWLEETPDSTTKVLFQKLQIERPGIFPDGQLPSSCCAGLDQRCPFLLTM